MVTGKLKSLFEKKLYRKNTANLGLKRRQAFQHCACPTMILSGVCCPLTNHSTEYLDTEEDEHLVRISKNMF